MIVEAGSIYTFTKAYDFFNDYISFRDVKTLKKSVIDKNSILLCTNSYHYTSNKNQPKIYATFLIDSVLYELDAEIKMIEAILKKQC